MRQRGLGGSRVGALLALAALAGCDGSAGDKAKEPAQVSGHVAETDLITVTLTPEAEHRLGIALARVERRTVAQTRMLGGEVISPAAGASAVTRYAATASMAPSDLAAAQIEADSTVEQARAAANLARSRYQRTERLFTENFASVRARDDAVAELRTAEAALRAAQGQRALYGQSVTSTRAAPRVWVRASIYAGDLDRLNRRLDARVSGLGAGGVSRAAKPVAAPATASALSSTAFVFYETDNRDGAFRMGERVEMEVPTTNQQEGLTVPWSAVLYDVNGGEWVYERTAKHVYARRRVEVRSVINDVAVLSRGPAVGAQIVSVGAPELFGTEFGVSH